MHHGHVSIAILAAWANERESADTFESVASWIGAHHGRLHSLEFAKSKAASALIIGDEGWRAARRDLIDSIQDAWFARYPVEQASTALRGALHTWLVPLGGWTTLADWLGSIASCFPRNTGTDPMEYMERSRKGALQALHQGGFDQRSSVKYGGFEQTFGFSPSPLQEAMASVPVPMDGAPSLVIVEAPTGEGKTEGAFVLAARQQEERKGSGIYVAMPTQATSNGLLPRTIEFLEKINAGNANFRLIHGNAELDPRQEALVTDVESLDTLFDADDVERHDRTPAKVHTLDWFTRSKRSLLAQYGLGTVDQGFLGILYARHFFLRLFALTGKTVVFDEIHAYDLYMQHLFKRLLKWLNALGADVILLSATLPAALRNSCFKAWGSERLEVNATNQDVPYPAVWVASGGSAALHAGNFPTRWHQSALLTRHDVDPEAVAESAVTAYRSGAVTIVICNTVRRAQAVYRAIPEELRARCHDVTLLHARFRFSVRQEREQQVLTRFGKKRANGEGAILVATQVAEQSLDLDADVLFSDLAPIDLLLQRAGRLHRHLEQRPSEDRPEGYRVPTVYWMCPAAEVGLLPDLGAIGIRTTNMTVYDSTVAWKSWHLLLNRDGWSLPHDYRTLIESVYGNENPPDGLSPEGLQCWNRGKGATGKQRARAHDEALRQLIPEPTRTGMRNLLEPSRAELADEDATDLHPSHRALTRLGAESVEVIILFGSEDGVPFLDPECTIPAPLAIAKDRKDLPSESVRMLLGNSVRISYEEIAAYLRDSCVTDSPRGWESAKQFTSALRHRFPILLTNRTADVGRFRISDDADLGVCIERIG